MGHSGSTYWRKKESEKSELFQNRALYHISQHTPAGKAGFRYHEQGKRIGGGERVPEGEGRKKDDAIAMLSDQLLTITERLRELERRQPWENK